LAEAVGTGSAGAVNATGSETEIAAKVAEAGFPLMKTDESSGLAAWIVASIEEGRMSLFDLVFGCWHKRCSFPITARGKLRRSTAAASVTGTYVVCLDCGREFPYDWSQMKMLESKSRTARAAEPVNIVPGLKAA
jgi:hypothetical protein